MSKHPSRAKRLDMAMNVVDGVINELQEIKDSEEASAVKIEKANTAIEDIDTSEIESLKEEIESWRDNLSGTALENTEKFSRLEECIDALDTVISDLEGISADITEIDQIDSAMDSLQQAIDDASSVEFPGMYG